MGRILLIVVALIAGASPPPAVGQDRPTTFVIVHGAWGGGWAWRGMERRLRAHGYEVLRPTLTGLGERMHLASPQIGLSTHIEDVVNVLVFEDAHEVVLVGHSYGGMVATGVADRVPERIRRLVYLDALVPEDGESVADLMPGLIASVQEGARARGRAREGFLVPYWSDPAAPLPKDVDQSLRTLTEPIELSSPPGAGLPVTYVLTREGADSSDAFDWAAERARRYGWDVRVMEADHVPYRTAPEALLDLLLELDPDGPSTGGPPSLSLVPTPTPGQARKPEAIPARPTEEGGPPRRSRLLAFYRCASPPADGRLELAGTTLIGR
ncbi:MAG: alpha/beta fold hydrolase [Gemmatimonadota bacterium]|jgi:pimeloyl-ACP methyl ester carboxylesterase